MEKINVGLPEEHLAGISESLNKLLADEHILYIKTRNYHWNVVGPRFNDLHKFFEEQYTLLEPMIDEIAENVRQFGGFALGTMAEFAQHARLGEEPGNIPDQSGMVRNLLEDHQTVIRQIRTDIERAEEEWNAPDAADFLTAMLENHNKMAWMLRSMLREVDREVQPTSDSSHELTGSRRS
jgi:starvation-inducible DNA-binding protein